MKINFNPVLCQGGTKSGLRIPKYIGPHEFKKVGGGNIGDDDFRTVGRGRIIVGVGILEEIAARGLSAINVSQNGEVRNFGFDRPATVVNRWFVTFWGMQGTKASMIANPKQRESRPKTDRFSQ